MTEGELQAIEAGLGRITHLSVRDAAAARRLLAEVRLLNRLLGDRLLDEPNAALLVERAVAAERDRCYRIAAAVAAAHFAARRASNTKRDYEVALLREQVAGQIASDIAPPVVERAADPR